MEGHHVEETARSLNHAILWSVQLIVNMEIGLHGVLVQQIAGVGSMSVGEIKLSWNSMAVFALVATMSLSRAIPIAAWSIANGAAGRIGKVVPKLVVEASVLACVP